MIEIDHRSNTRCHAAGSANSPSHPPPCMLSASYLNNRWSSERKGKVRFDSTES